MTSESNIRANPQKGEHIFLVFFSDLYKYNRAIEIKLYLCGSHRVLGA